MWKIKKLFSPIKWIRELVYFNYSTCDCFHLMLTAHPLNQEIITTEFANRLQTQGAFNASPFFTIIIGKIEMIFSVRYWNNFIHWPFNKIDRFTIKQGQNIVPTYINFYNRRYMVSINIVFKILISGIFYHKIRYFTVILIILYMYIIELIA